MNAVTVERCAVSVILLLQDDDEDAAMIDMIVKQCSRNNIMFVSYDMVFGWTLIGL